MKLYGAAMSANTRRVKIYLAEKGLDNIEEVDLVGAANVIKTPEYLAKNPAGKIPLLELDDGTFLRSLPPSSNTWKKSTPTRR